MTVRRNEPEAPWAKSSWIHGCLRWGRAPSPQTCNKCFSIEIWTDWGLHYNIWRTQWQKRKLFFTPLLKVKADIVLTHRMENWLSSVRLSVMAAPRMSIAPIGCFRRDASSWFLKYCRAHWLSSYRYQWRRRTFSFPSAAKFTAQHQKILQSEDQRFTPDALQEFVHKTCAAVPVFRI